jgi:hypothetical protein
MESGKRGEFRSQERGNNPDRVFEFLHVHYPRLAAFVVIPAEANQRRSLAGIQRKGLDSPGLRPAGAGSVKHGMTFDTP